MKYFDGLENMKMDSPKRITCFVLHYNPTWNKFYRHNLNYTWFLYFAIDSWHDLKQQTRMILVSINSMH